LPFALVKKNPPFGTSERSDNAFTKIFMLLAQFPAPCPSQLPWRRLPSRFSHLTGTYNMSGLAYFRPLLLSLLSEFLFDVLPHVVQLGRLDKTAVRFRWCLAVPMDGSRLWVPKARHYCLAGR